MMWKVKGVTGKSASRRSWRPGKQLWLQLNGINAKNFLHFHRKSKSSKLNRDQWVGSIGFLSAIVPKTHMAKRRNLHRLHLRCGSTMISKGKKKVEISLRQTSHCGIPQTLITIWKTQITAGTMDTKGIFLIILPTLQLPNRRPALFLWN